MASAHFTNDFIFFWDEKTNYLKIKKLSISEHNKIMKEREQQRNKKKDDRKFF